jgi:pimeloyl-ACP methyl ester carboxylesterase
MRSFTIPSGKAELTGVEDGKGPALVFLHAGVADKRMWRDQMAAFADRYRVVAYDRRGFGETRYKPETFSHMQDLRAVLDGLGIEQASLVGCSQGGRFSVDFTLAYPQRVNKLVLIAPASRSRKSCPTTSTTCCSRRNRLRTRTITTWSTGSKRTCGSTARGRSTAASRAPRATCSCA